MFGVSALRSIVLVSLLKGSLSIPGFSGNLENLGIEDRTSGNLIMRNYQGFMSQVYFLHIGSRSYYNLFAFYLIEIDKAPVCLILLHAYAFNPEFQTKDGIPTCLRPAQEIRWLQAYWKCIPTYLVSYFPENYTR